MKNLGYVIKTIRYLVIIETYRERSRDKRPIDEGIAPFNKLLDISLRFHFRVHHTGKATSKLITYSS